MLDCTQTRTTAVVQVDVVEGLANCIMRRSKRTGAFLVPTRIHTSGMGAAGKCHGTPLPPAAPHHGGPMAVATVKGYTNTVSNNWESMITITT